MKRMEWINWMYHKYLDDNTIGCKFYTDKKTIEVYTLTSRYRKQSAFSYCHDDDKFDVAIGIAIAYARLIGEKVPDYVLQNKIIVKDVEIGGMFILKFNHKTYVKVCEHPSYPNEYSCTCIENGEMAIISDDSEVEKIF